MGAPPPSWLYYALSGLAALGTLQVLSNARLPTFVASWLQKWSLRCRVFTHLVRVEQNAFWGLSQRTLKKDVLPLYGASFYHHRPPNPQHRWAADGSNVTGPLPYRRLLPAPVFRLLFEPPNVRTSECPNV